MTMQTNLGICWDNSGARVFMCIKVFGWYSTSVKYASVGRHHCPVSVQGKPSPPFGVKEGWTVAVKPVVVRTAKKFVRVRWHEPFRFAIVKRRRHF